MNSFLSELLKLKPQEIIGVARILNIPLMENENTPRQGEQIIIDIINKYNSKNRATRRRLLKIIKEANK